MNCFNSAKHLVAFRGHPKCSEKKEKKEENEEENYYDDELTLAD